MPDVSRLLEEAETLAAKATKGPWTLGDRQINDAPGPSRVCLANEKGPDCGRQVAMTFSSGTNPNHLSDAEFIAWCREGVPQLCKEIRRLREALQKADAEASVAHNAIWSAEVQGLGGTGFGILHDNDNPKSAQAAIWRLHEIARAALAEPQP